MSKESCVTTVNLQPQLAQKLLEKIVQDGYGMRGKNKWILEAIDAFFKLPDYPDLVDIAQDMTGSTKALSIRLPKELSIRIEDAVIVIRKQYPSLEGVKSNLVRASIMQRLFGNGFRPAKTNLTV